MARRLLLSLVALAAFVLPAPVAQAAGETTHVWMVDRAIDFLPAGELKQLLEVQRLMALSGAAYPDSGYWAEPGPVGNIEPRPSDSFGEISHWEGFVNTYIAHIKAQQCADLRDPVGPCAPLIAHLMGAAGHGLGDEMWDWLFEPAMADHGEDPAQNFFAADRPAGPLAGNPLDDASSSPEYAMDEVAIFAHNRWLLPELGPPPVNDLTAVYADMGLDVTPEHIVAGNEIGTAMMSAERAVAPVEGPRVQEDMPWSSANFVTAPGGVDDVGHALDGYFQAIWRKLLEPTHPAPEVTARYPADGAVGVPVKWLPARTAPGPYGGGSQNRIVFVLSNAVDPASLTAGTARLLDGAGADVPQLGGFPQAGPYGADAGTHTVMLYPAADLDPCANYTVVVTRALRDIQGGALRDEVRWLFRTACPN